MQGGFPGIHLHPVQAHLAHRGHHFAAEFQATRRLQQRPFALAPDLALVALLVRLGDLHVFGIRQYPHRRDELLLASLALRHPLHRLVAVARAVLHRATDQEQRNQQQQDQPTDGGEPQ